eukprot:8127801-Alexandrium_andersonii.AAC.1
MYRPSPHRVEEVKGEASAVYGSALLPWTFGCRHAGQQLGRAALRCERSLGRSWPHQERGVAAA